MKTVEQERCEDSFKRLNEAFSKLTKETTKGQQIIDNLSDILGDLKRANKKGGN